MTRCAALRTLVLLALVGGVQPAWAAAQPVEPDDSVEARIRRLERAAREFAPARPSAETEVRQAGPGAEQFAGIARDPLGNIRPGLLREGATVIDVRGRVANTSAGWIFAADPVAPSGDDDRVLLRLLPGPASERLRAEVVARESEGLEPATFRLSGRVLTDRGRVFLLPTFATIVSPPAAPEDRAELLEDEDDEFAWGPENIDEERETKPARAPEREPERDEERDPSVRALIERLERASEADREGLDETLLGYAPSEEAGVRLVLARSARLSRGSDGRLAALFEAGSASPTRDEALPSTRMVFLPCRLLGALEGVWASRGDGARLLVSGEAFRDGNEWFLLPSLVEVEPPAMSGLRTLR